MQKPLGIARILASLPLLAIGAMHFTGSAPLLPILEGANVPQAELIDKLAPIAEIVAGLLLLMGYRARIGALLGIGSMAGAIATHLKFVPTEAFAWPDEPPIALPIAVLVLCLLVLAKGPGAWAVGRRGGG